MLVCLTTGKSQGEVKHKVVAKQSKLQMSGQEQMILFLTAISFKLTLREAFHFNLQVMEDGRPFLDMAHVITSLNRLDSGIPDKVGQVFFK